jgi:SAM-dependent methyltransferase
VGAALILWRGSALKENILPYYAEGGLSAAFHDVLAELEPGCKGDAAFYLSLLSVDSGRILELGCGAGRLSFELSKYGHSVAGIDIAESMLQIAEVRRSRIEKNRARRIEFIRADMTTFSIPENFHLVIAPYFALNHLPSHEAVHATFMRAAEHLEPDGYFAMHVHDIDRLSRPLEREAATQVTIRYDKEGNKLQLNMLERHLDPITRYFTLLMRYSLIGADGAIERTSSERLIYRAIEDVELDSAAASVGLCREGPKVQAGETGYFLTFRKPAEHQNCVGVVV